MNCFDLWTSLALLLVQMIYYKTCIAHICDEIYLQKKYIYKYIHTYPIGYVSKLRFVQNGIAEQWIEKISTQVYKL